MQRTHVPQLPPESLDSHVTVLLHSLTVCGVSDQMFPSPHSYVWHMRLGYTLNAADCGYLDPSSTPLNLLL